jgi:hypothetical protein
MEQNQFAEICSKLKEIGLLIKAGPIPQSPQYWIGADVQIVQKIEDEKRKPDFYPRNRVLVTPYAGEFSWLFEQLRDVFYATRAIDYTSKEEFFGRLANAALRHIQKHGAEELTPKPILLAVLSEAFRILEELSEGELETLLITAENVIFDDTKE